MSFAPPLSKLGESGIGVAFAPTGGMGLALEPDGKVPGTTLKLTMVSADPDPPFEGQVWIRTDLNELRWREGSVTYKVAGTAV